MPRRRPSTLHVSAQAYIDAALASTHDSQVRNNLYIFNSWLIGEQRFCMAAPKLIILCFDALERELFGSEYENLRLTTYGNTDISEFKLPRSVILWSSFLTSRNMEIHLKDMLYEFGFGPFRVRIPTDVGDTFERHIWGGWSGKILGKLAPLRKYLKERIWSIKLKPKKTFLRYFTSYVAIDMVALSHKRRRHKRERELMSDYFNYNVEEGIIDKLREIIHKFYYGNNEIHKNQKDLHKMDEILKNYERLAWEGHLENKAELFDALDKDYEIILFFTPLADLIGHINFGSEKEMRDVYRELNSLVGSLREMVKDKGTTIIGISDHGMEQVVFKTRNGHLKKTRYGDHSEVKQGIYFINRTVEEIRGRYIAIQNSVQENEIQIFNVDEQNDIEEALIRLEKGNPTLRDFYHIIKIYGSKNPIKHIKR